VKSWKGIPSVNFDERSTVEKLGADALPNVADDASEKIEIGDLGESGGALDVTIQGFVVEIRSGSGLIFRCPECKRVVQKGICAVHGKVTGVPDLRIKAIIDDGTGTINAVFGRDLAELVLGKKLDEVMAIAKDAMDTDVIVQDIQNILLIQPVVARGSVMSDNFGLMLIGKQLELAQRDVAAEVEKLFSALESIEEHPVAGTSEDEGGA
jgi:replication factor A1